MEIADRNEITTEQSIALCAGQDQASLLVTGRGETGEVNRVYIGANQLGQMFS